MYEKSSKWNLVEVRKRICMNVKRIRKEHYDEYKRLYDNKKGTENSYSTINISSILGISNKYYQRLENANDKYKNISSDNLYKLADVFEISIDEFYK